MKDTIDIQVTATIFDDPEFCNSDNDIKRCEYVNHECATWTCKLFIDYLEVDNSRLIKCDQCKEVWKKAKESNEPQVSIHTESADERQIYSASSGTWDTGIKQQ